MAITHVNPDEMRHFAQYLDAMTLRIRSKQGRLDEQFRDLSAFWKDAKYKRFEGVYGEFGDKLGKFLRMMEVYSEFLQRKAALGDKFLDHQY